MVDAHLHIDAGLLERLKAHCKRRGTPMKDFAAQVLEDMLAPVPATSSVAEHPSVLVLAQFCRNRGLDSREVLRAAIEQEMQRERRKVLPMLSSDTQRPEPWTLPPFWLGGRA
jgi:hypothetical protein